jgi:SPP1 family predicted phage head-tail adaptor
VTDAYGFDTQTDVVVYRCWASIEPARGKVFYEMERKADTEYSKITIRWRPGVTHDMKVKYQNHLYDIDCHRGPIHAPRSPGTVLYGRSEGDGQ